MSTYSEVGYVKMNINFNQVLNLFLEIINSSFTNIRVTRNVNFKARRISRGARKLVQTFMFIFLKKVSVVFI